MMFKQTVTGSGSYIPIWYPEKLDVCSWYIPGISKKEEVKLMKDNVKKIIIHPPTITILWKDGTKTEVNCKHDEKFDAEKGIAMCFMRKMFRSKSALSKYIKDTIAENADVIAKSLVRQDKKNFTKILAADEKLNSEVAYTQFVDGRVGVTTIGSTQDESQDNI